MTFGQPESPLGDPGGERDADGGEVDQRLPLGRSTARRTRLPQATRSRWQRRRAALLMARLQAEERVLGELILIPAPETPEEDFGDNDAPARHLELMRDLQRLREEE
jgi:hypothetical protein